jgi:tRNA A-37 threonylcarbamoyl transferase component Bud32
MTNRPENTVAQKEQASLDAFERAWQEGQAPQIRCFFSPAQGGSDGSTISPSVLLELVLVDLWHRWRRASRSTGPAALGWVPPGVAAKDPVDDLPSQPLLEDYARALPEIGSLSDLPLDAVAEEYRARVRWGSGASEGEYIARFPGHAAELPGRLAAVRNEVYTASVLAETPTGEFKEGLTPVAVSSSTADFPAAPRSIGRYQVIGTLDEGGQARVYRAVHPELARELVIKLGRDPIAAGEDGQDRLIAESRMLAELDDPAIAKVFDAGVYEKLPYVAMEYVRGPNLRQYFDEHRPSARQSAAILAACARGVAKAHARGITHQDLKPKNIVIDERGQPRILDFGLATFRHAWSERAAESGQISGTPEYMPPEQAAGRTSLIGPRSDVFALGGVLYFLLVGHAPFQGKNVLDVLAKAQTCDFDSAAIGKRDIPPALARICLRAMQADPQARYPTAAAMAGDLERFLARPRRIRRAMLAAAAAGLLLAIGALGRMLYLSGVSAGAGTKPDPGRHARQVLGRPLSQEFAVDFKLLGQDGNSPTEVKLADGQRIVCRVTPDRDCYLGIWLLDEQGKATPLFPNRYESDDRLRAGVARTIPGDLKYAAKAKLSARAEYLYVVATTQPGRNRLSPLEQSRDVTLDSDTSPLASEMFLSFHVVPKR